MVIKHQRRGFEALSYFKKIPEGQSDCNVKIHVTGVQRCLEQSEKRCDRCTNSDRKYLKQLLPSRKKGSLQFLHCAIVLNSVSQFVWMLHITIFLQNISMDTALSSCAHIQLSSCSVVKLIPLSYIAYPRVYLN